MSTHASARPPGPDSDVDPAAERPRRGDGVFAETPWDRWQWLLSCMWLVFLAFPAMALFDSTRDLSGAEIGLGLGILAVFAGVTMWGYYDIGRTDWGWPTYRIAIRTMGLQVALMSTLSLLNQYEAIGSVPFVVAFAVFSLPWRWVIGIAVTGAGLAFSLPTLGGELELGIIFLAVTTFVGTVTSVIRLVDSRQTDHQIVTEELSLVRERERVARDVHDVLGHSLTVVTVKAELAERLLDVDVEASRREIAQIRSLTREALSEVRATVAGLRVARLGDELESARGALTDAGISVEVTGSPDDVDPRHRLVLAWILREGVTNVVRHSHASACRITLEPRSLQVQDDGRGAAASTEGNGIRGARERLREAGGTLLIEPGLEGRGTTWKARL